MKTPKVEFVYVKNEEGIKFSVGIVIALGPGAVGWSRRMPMDDSNPKLGLEIALGRAMAAMDDRSIQKPPKVMRDAYRRMCKAFPRPKYLTLGSPRKKQITVDRWGMEFPLTPKHIIDEMYRQSRS